MSGTASVPNILGSLAGGNEPLSLIDANFTALINYINAREITSGSLASRPAVGVSGRWYAATDTKQLFFDTGAAWVLVAYSAVLGGFLSGCGLSNDAGTPNTILDVAAGTVASDDGSQYITIGALTGTTGGTFVAGTGQPKLDAGTVAASTWYHVFAIGQTSATADILFSASATAPTLPSGYTVKRRLGSFLTDGSSNILAFTQDGNLFEWASPPNNLAGNTLGTAAITQGLSTPNGVNVQAIIDSRLAALDGVEVQVYFSDLAQSDVAPSNVVCSLAAGWIAGATAVVGASAGRYQVRTNTSSQIRVRLSASTANTTLIINTIGWIDRRGQG